MRLDAADVAAGVRKWKGWDEGGCSCQAVPLDWILLSCGCRAHCTAVSVPVGRSQQVQQICFAGTRWLTGYARSAMHFVVQGKLYSCYLQL
jgi:hypothetical protein